MKWKLETETGNGNQKLKTNGNTTYQLLQSQQDSIVVAFDWLLCQPSLIPRPSSSPVLTWVVQVIVCSQQYSILGIPHLLTSWFCINMLPGPKYEAIICLTHCKQSKLEVGLGTRLQEQECLPCSEKKYVTLMVRLQQVYMQSHAQTRSHVNQTRLEDCLQHEHHSISLEAVITKHSTGVKAQHDP